MDGFLGIDVGTTNSKAVLLGENGDILSIWKQETPQVLKDGRSYFDIEKIDACVDHWIEEAGKVSELKSVGFSSVGESVIPLKSGKVLSMPLVWHEQTDDIPKWKEEIFCKKSGFANTGVHKSSTFAVYKMIWMMEHVLSGIPDMWLPISSYLTYSRTGIARWDTSQAGRSYLYDIHKKTWDLETAEKLHIKLPKSVGSLGGYCGSKDGIVYGLGGHDHYVGLYAVRKLYGSSELFYDSMGSSSVLAMVKADGEKKLRGTATFNPKGGCLVTGFEPEEYVVNRSLDYYGRVLKCLAGLAGKSADQAFYADGNQGLFNLPDADRLCRLACPKDYGRYAEHARHINLLDVKENMSFSELILSGYVYMAVGTEKMYADLSRYCNGSQKEMPYFTGGGITDNQLFMQFKAAALGREITILKTSEISGLGAAISGLCASGRENLLRDMKKKLLAESKVVPQLQYADYLAEMKKRYEAG